MSVGSDEDFSVEAGYNNNILRFLSLALCIGAIVILAAVGKLKHMRNQSRLQQRRLAHTPTRSLFPQREPTVYVTPSNLPVLPPHTFGNMAPPSYEEAVGTSCNEPITRPIASSLAQNSTVAVRGS